MLLPIVNIFIFSTYHFFNLHLFTLPNTKVMLLPIVNMVRFELRPTEYFYLEPTRYPNSP